VSARKPGRPPKFASEAERREHYNRYQADYQRRRRLKTRLFGEGPQFRTKTTANGRDVRYPISPPQEEYDGADLEVISSPSYRSEYPESSTPDAGILGLMKEAAILESGRDIKIFEDQRLPRIFSFDDEIHVVLHYPTFYRSVIENIRDDGVVVKIGTKGRGEQEVQSWVFDRNSLLFDPKLQNAFMEVVGDLVKVNNHG